MNGLLCGLVAVTGGAGVLEPWAAALTGFVSGFLYSFGSKTLLYFRLDDAVDAIPIHMLNAIWGLIAVGLFASPRRMVVVYNDEDHPGWFYTLTQPDGSSATLLGVQLCGILFIIGWVFVTMFPFFILMDWSGWFRSEPMEEIVGLDRSYHGGLALRNGEEVVHPEYITAYRQRREEGNVKRRRSRLRGDFDTDSARFELVGARDANLDDSSIGEDDDEPVGIIEQ
jgi:Amt family ammonium transporter